MVAFAEASATEAGGKEGVGMLIVAGEGAAELGLEPERAADPFSHFFIFPFKDGAGTIDEGRVRRKLRGDVAEDLPLPVAVFFDRCGIEKIEGFRSAAPGTAAGAGNIGEDEVGACGAGGRGLEAKVGEEGRIALDTGGGETGAEVFQDGCADVGGGDMEVGIHVPGEDGLSAASGAGVPEKFGFLTY